VNGGTAKAIKALLSTCINQYVAQQMRPAFRKKVERMSKTMTANDVTTAEWQLLRAWQRVFKDDRCYRRDGCAMP
jgi:hypothetical protein